MKINEIMDILLKNDYHKYNDYRINDVINYLSNIKDEFTLDTNKIGISEALEKKRNPNHFIDINIYIKDNTLSIAYPLTDILTLIKTNLNKSIKKLTVPIDFLEDSSILEEFPNLEELNINTYSSLNKDLLDYIVSNTSIKKLSFDSFLFGDIDYTDYILIDNGLSNTGRYKTILLENKNHKSSKETITVITSNLNPKDLDSIISSITTSTKEINIKSNTEEYNIKLNNNSVTIDINTTNINIAKNIVDKFKKNNYVIDKVYINLELSTGNFTNKDKLHYLDYDYTLLDKLSKIVDLNVKYNIIDSSTWIDFKSLVETMKYYKDLITTSNLSPIEQLTYAYDLVKSFKYNETKLNDKSLSRDPYKIIKTGNIVCSGYTQLLKEIIFNLNTTIQMNTFGVTCYDDNNEKLGNHSRTFVRIDDDKYNIHGIYILDPTWDSYKDIGYEVIGKNYTGLDLYRYFLIRLEDYNKVFKNDSNVPIFNYDRNDLNNKEKLSLKDIKKIDLNYNLSNLLKDLTEGEILSYLYPKKIQIDELKKIIMATRLAEGYTPKEAKEDIERISTISANRKSR